MKRMSVLEGEKFVYRGQRVLSQIENCSKVVIAAINGYALGGGMELAMACDIRIASEKAKLGLPETCIGLYPGWGGTQRLVRLVGKGIAKELVFTGCHLSAEEAKELGIVNKVVKHENLMNHCYQLAEKILANSPIAVMQAKKAINQGSEISLDQGLVLEAEAWLVNFSTEDRVEGLTAFLEKRKPQYRGQ
jgi:enoyl-CoA hydratase/carnithine racemase